MNALAGIGHNGGPRLLQPSDQILWAPQSGPQALLVSTPIKDVMFGGARGGGKTDAMLGDWLLHANTYGRYANGLMVRRTMEALAETTERAKELFLPLGARYLKQSRTFVMPGGARLKMRYLDRDEDAQQYQGHSYTRIYVEELTQFPNADPVLKLFGALRSAHGVPTAFRATANPGGPGHLWVKRRYIDPYPAGNRVIREWEPRSGMWQERLFIPSKVQDNKILMDSDPDYIARLAQTGSASLVKAWLDGDWSVIEGAFFDCWTDRMVVKPHPIPKRWTLYRSMDWGSASPFSVGWWALSDGYPVEIPGLPPSKWPVYPKGALIRYREWYGADKDQKGLKMQNAEIGRGIASRTPPEEKKRIALTLCDPSMFKQDGGPSIAEQIWKGGKFLMKRADNSRIAGWAQMRARMMGHAVGDDANKPMIYVFETCVNSIRTIPVLQHDDINAEDLDTDGEDHAADDWRYMCNSRPFQRKLATGPGEVPYGHIPTLAEVIAKEQRSSRKNVAGYRSI